MERSIPYAVLDNIIGFRDDHETPGEKLGKALGEDPLGVATTVVKGVGKLAKSAFDRVVEEGPLDALTGSLSEYAESLIGSGKRLTSGTQGYINSGMTQAAARDAQISDALRLSEIFPLMSTAAYSARLGRAAIPDAPFDPSRRGFLGGIAALPAVAALAPDALTGVLKSVGPKVARAASSLDLSVAKINALIKRKELLAQQADELRLDPSFSDSMQAGNRNDVTNASLQKDLESFRVETKIEEAALKALDDLKPADFSNAADDSIETIAEQFSNYRYLEDQIDNPAFDGLMEQVKLRGMNNAKDARGIDQFPYARSIFEDYYNPIDFGGVKVPPSMFKPPVPKSLNMVEGAPTVGRTVAPDIVEKIKDLNISRVIQKMELEERKMIVEGKSASEIDAMKAELRQELYKLQNEGTEDFSKDFFADGGAVMQGVGSLNETARNMSRGPRGIAGYQQFADGGPVYMQEGGEPQVFNQKDQQDIFSQIEMMDRNKTYTTNETRNLRADLIEQFGDTELGADLMPFLKNDPIAMLGYKAERMLGKNKSKVLSYDFRNNNNTAASYTPDSDIVKYNSDTASSLDIIIHELRHRGINILRQNLINDGVDPDRPSTSATGPNEAQRNFVQQYGSNAYDILLKSPAAKEEFFVELMDDPDATYISPQGYAVPSEDTVPSEDMTQAEYIASLTQPMSDNMQFVNLEDVRTRRETGVYPEGPDVELPFYWAGGPGFSLDAKVGAISRENIDAGMAGVNKAATDLLQRNKMLQRANATKQ